MNEETLIILLSSLTIFLGIAFSLFAISCFVGSIIHNAKHNKTRVCKFPGCYNKVPKDSVSGYCRECLDRMIDKN